MLDFIPTRARVFWNSELAYFPGMKLPWECHDQSQDTYWRHCVTGPELPFFHKRKGVLKIDQSVKMPWHKLGMAVVRSYSSASVNFAKEENLRSSINIFFGTLYGVFFWANRRFPSADDRGVKNGEWKSISGIWTHRGKQEKSKQTIHNFTICVIHTYLIAE